MPLVFDADVADHPDALPVERLGRGGMQAEVVDATPPPHRRLPVGLGVAVDGHDVQLGVRADADDRHRLPGVLPVWAGGTDLGVEDLGVEPAEARDVV